MVLCILVSTSTVCIVLFGNRLNRGSSALQQISYFSDNWGPEMNTITKCTDSRDICYGACFAKRMLSCACGRNLFHLQGLLCSGQWHSLAMKKEGGEGTDATNNFYGRATFTNARGIKISNSMFLTYSCN